MALGTIASILTGNEAQDAQVQASNDANATQKYIFDQNRADQEPWRMAGAGALQGLQNQEFQKDFTMADFQADPGYAFRMAEGQKAIERAAAARGGASGGATLKSLSRFNSDIASAEYDKSYNRFNADKDRRFNRLSNLAGLGQTANAANAASGQNYGNNVSANQIGAGNAIASNWIAKGNAVNTGLEKATQAAFAMCDERLKTDIEEISKEDISEFRAAIKPYKFRYINDSFGKGEFIGPMAQDLQKSKIGASMVYANEEGFLQIDMRRAIMALLAMEAEA